MNKVFLLGNLGKDPEMRSTQNGMSVANFSIAVNEAKDKVEFWDIVAFDKTADHAEKWLHKGSRVCIEGRLSKDKWTDKETGKPRTATKIIADRIYFADKAEQTRKPAQDDFVPVEDEELPFN